MENITVIRSKRRTVSIEIKNDLSVIVRVPLKMKDNEITRFVDTKAGWINKHIALIKQQNEHKSPALTDEEISALTNEAKVYFPARTEYYAERIGVAFGSITIRHQRKRWGSCSSKGDLNFNCLLMLCPCEVRDYVVVHELCHRIEMNHSSEFWAHVGNVMPVFAQYRKWLKENGNEIIGRIR